MSIGSQFLNALASKGTMADYIGFGPMAHLFKGGNEQALFEYVATHAKKFASLPKPDTIEAHTKLDLSAFDEPFEYYFDVLQKRHIQISMRDSMKEAAEYLKGDDMDPDKALEIMAKSVLDLLRDKSTQQIVDFRDAYETVISTYAATYTKTDLGMRLGWPYLDRMTGGLVKGDMLSMVGRPQQGKTFALLYACASQWIEEQQSGKAEDDMQDCSRMFVTMEMSPTLIQQRLAAMVTSVPMSKLKHAELSTPQMKKLRDGLTEVRGFGAPLWIIDGNLTATVENIYILARQLKPKGILIDGAYLLKHPTEKDRYRRAAENAELIKKELASIAPTIASYQFAKSASKKMSKGQKGGDKVDLDDIGYTDAIAQVSSVVAGLFQPESVETILRRKVSILKGRSGEVGDFYINWDFIGMNFSEHVEEELADLQFV